MPKFSGGVAPTSLGSLLMARHWQKHQKQFWKGCIYDRVGFGKDGGAFFKNPCTHKIRATGFVYIKAIKYVFDRSRGYFEDFKAVV